LEQRVFRHLSAPMLNITFPDPEEPFDIAPYQALIFTSANGVRAFARAGSRICWKSASFEGTIPVRALRGRWGGAGVAGGLLALLAALTVLGGPVTAYTGATAAQLCDPQH